MSLPTEWQQWLDENLQRGCTPTDLLRLMVDNGITPSHAENALRLSQERLLLPSLTIAHGADQLPSWFEQITRNPPSHIQTPQGAVQVLYSQPDPNIIVLGNFLSETECDALIAAATPKMQRSAVVHNTSGAHYIDPVRTSTGTYFQRGENELIRTIEARIAAVMNLPVENGEGIQVLHYNVSQEYKPHYDYFPPESSGSRVHTKLESGGQRIATLVMYLNTVPAGGETFFPTLGCKVTAVKGNACLFSYMFPDGSLDKRSLHSGNPVLAGDKWIATKWMRQARYG